MKLAWALNARRIALAARYAIANYGPILPPAFVPFARMPPKRKMPYRHTEPHQYFVPLVSHFIAKWRIAPLPSDPSRAESSHEFLRTASKIDSPLTP